MGYEDYCSTQVVRRFNVSPEKVFDAWLDEGLLQKWQFVAVYPETAKLEMDACVGGGYKFSEWIWGEEYVQSGTYIEIDRPRRLVIGETYPMDSENTGRLAVKIAPRQDGCELTLTVDAHSSEAKQYSTRYGWAIVLERLASTLASLETEVAGATPELPTARVTRHISATPECVFDAWLDPEFLGQWMFGPKVREEEVLHLEVNPKVGGSFSFLVRRGDAEIDHIGEYLEIDRPHRLDFTWGVRKEDGTEFSRVTVDVVPVGDGSELKIAHEMGPKWADFVERARGSWQLMADALARALE